MNDNVNSLAKIENAEDFFNELFDFSEECPVDIKKVAIATNFSALIHHVGKSKSEIADDLGWKRSRLSKVLSGEQNLTIKTMVDLSNAVGYDFDVIFHKSNVFSHRSLQPWESNLLIQLNPYQNSVMVDIEPKLSGLEKVSSTNVLPPVKSDYIIHELPSIDTSVYANYR